MMKKNLITILIFPLLLLVLTVAQLPAAQAQEGVQFFGASGNTPGGEQSKGRNLLSCLQGWRQFLAAGIGLEDTDDYFRDFFLWPMHYFDVANVQNQVNRARYAVMAAYLRCDLTRLKSVTQAYYQLEAELYFLRHYVDTSGGFLRVLTTKSERQKFVNDMIKYFVLRKQSENPDSDRALFGAYFDIFETKYQQRAEQYAKFKEDPVYSELFAKVQEIVDGFKNLASGKNELTSELYELGADVGTSTFGAAIRAYKNPKKALKNAGLALLKKFDACVDTSDARYCATSDSVKKEGGIFEGTEIGKWIKLGEGLKKSSTKKTFKEVMIGLSKVEEKRTTDLDKADMRVRYELLYGQVNGDGVSAVVSEVSDIIKILGQGQQADPAKNIPKIPGSLAPLDDLRQCARDVIARQCS